MKKQKITQPMCATERVSILTALFNLKSTCLAMLLLLSFTSIAQNLQKRPNLLPGQCADLSIDREKTTITPAGNFIPGCTPITYVVRICNYGNCAASGVPIEFRLPKEFILTNPDAFKFIRNDITGDKVYGTSVNFPPIDPLTGETCVEFRFEGKLDKNADPDTKYGFYTTFEFTENGTLYRDADRSWLTPPNGLIKIQGDARNIPILNNSNAATFGSVVYIEGDLDFYPTTPSSNTRLFWLQNYNISVAPNVKLTVNAHAKLNIVNSNIHGCDQMWEGIVVKSGAELETYKDATNENTEIHDAKKAIKAAGDALVDCRDTKFIDNYIGVSLENAHEVFVHKNTSFTGTGKLLPAVGINVGKIPYAGITASNNSVLVAVGAEFSNLANGIMGTKSIIDVRDNVFTDIKKTDAYASSGQGIVVNNGSSKRDLKISNCSFANIEEVAIRASKADVEVTGGKNAKIANTPVGIIVTKTDKLTVDGIKFDAADQGISAVLNHDLRMNIHSNEFKNGNSTGISLRFNTFPEKGVISSNKMDLQGRAAILSEYPTYGQGFSIENNPEIYFSGKNAINISEGQNVIVQKNNDIWFKSGDHAVNWEGGSDNTTYCNSIRTELNTNSGLRVEMSSKPLLACNTVNYKYEKTGIRLDGVSMFTDFAANTMMTTTPNPAIAGLGLRLNENAVIGGQKYQGNVFEQSGAMNLNPDYYTSRFTVWDGGLQNYLPKFVSPQFWFNRNVPAPGEFQKQCSSKGTSCTLGSTTIIDTPPTDGQLFVAGISEGRFAQESNWIMRRQFFDKLIADPIVLNLQPEEVRSKIELIKNTEIGKLNQIAHLMQNLYKGNLELETQKLTLNENMETLLSQLKDLENRYFNDTEIEKISILQERNQIFDQMNTLQVEIDANSEAIRSQLIQKVEAISHLNNSFSTEILPAANEQVTNSLYLKAIALEDHALSPVEESNLSSIAFQCPLQGGSAVYRARSIYEYLYGETEFGNSCDIIQPRLVANPAQIQSTIYPNPAADYVMLQLLEKDYNSIVKVTFTDMNGRIVKEEICNAVERINIETLANGLYAVLVKNNISGEILHSQKILISKN